MAMTAHFIDESWRLRNILMRYIVVKALNIVGFLFSAFANSQTVCMCAYCRFIYVPAPHNVAAIARMLHESVVEWILMRSS